MSYIFLGKNSLQCQLAAAFHLYDKPDLSKIKDDDNTGTLNFMGQDKDGNDVYWICSQKNIELVPIIFDSLADVYQIEGEHTFKNVEVKSSFKYTVIYFLSKITKNTGLKGLRKKLKRQELEYILENFSIKPVSNA